MKKRYGYVSNSSSSSFVVYAYQDDDITMTRVERIIDRVISAYNILKEDTLKKDNVLEISVVDIQLAKKKVEYMEIDGAISKEQKKWVKDCIGKIVIHSVDDNSIPYVMQEMIESELYTDMWHWG